MLDLGSAAIEALVQVPVEVQSFLAGPACASVAANTAVSVLRTARVASKVLEVVAVLTPVALRIASAIHGAGSAVRRVLCAEDTRVPDLVEVVSLGAPGTFLLSQEPVFALDAVPVYGQAVQALLGDDVEVHVFPTGCAEELASVAITTLHAALVNFGAIQAFVDLSVEELRKYGFDNYVSFLATVAQVDGLHDGVHSAGLADGVDSSADYALVLVVEHL